MLGLKHESSMQLYTMKRLAEQRLSTSLLPQLQLDNPLQATMSYYPSIKRVNFKYLRAAMSISNNSINIHTSTSISNKEHPSGPQSKSRTRNQHTTTKLHNQPTITTSTTYQYQRLFTLR